MTTASEATERTQRIPIRLLHIAKRLGLGEHRKRTGDNNHYTASGWFFTEAEVSAVMAEAPALDPTRTVYVSGAETALIATAKAYSLGEYRKRHYSPEKYQETKDERNAWSKQGWYFTPAEYERLLELTPPENPKKPKPAPPPPTCAILSEPDPTRPCRINSAPIRKLAHSMGFGCYLRRMKNGGKSLPYGWFFSTAEVDSATAEYERQIADNPTRSYRYEYEKKRSAGLPTRSAGTRSDRARARAESCFRAELADPLSHRTPEEAWAYACGIFDFDGPMPAVDVQRASRDALLVASATSRNIDRREAYRSCAPTGTVRPA